MIHVQQHEKTHQFCISRVVISHHMGKITCKVQFFICRDLLPSFPQSYHKNIKKMCQNGRKTQIICTEAAFAASLTHSSGPFLDFDFAFGVFSGESFAAVSFTRASSFSMADSLGSADFS